MQRKIDNEAQLGKTVSPFDTTGQSSSINRTASKFKRASEKVKKIKCLINTGEFDANLAKYIPGMLELAYQGMIENIDKKEQVAHISYKDMETLEFQIMLISNYYTNPNSMHICFPLKIKKATNENTDLDTDLITLNHFFAHFVKEINITRYGKDKQLMPTFPPYEIYQYSDVMLKHLPEKALKKLQDTLLYSKKNVTYNKSTTDRRTYNSTTLGDITDDNLDDRIDKFQNQLKSEFVYRTPLCYFTDIGKINFPLKFDFKIECHLETDMKKLFQSRKMGKTAFRKGIFHFKRRKTLFRSKS